MSNNQPRFSRRFLSILMLLTAIAVVLFSRLQPPENDEEPNNNQDLQTESNQP